MNKLKFYLHNSYDCNEIRELLSGKFPNFSESQLERAAEAIHGRFYEVAFDITLDESGDIKSVEFDK